MVFKMSVCVRSEGYEKLIQDCPDYQESSENIGSYLACSSNVPLFDHRNKAKNELKLNPMLPSIEHENIVSDFIFDKYCCNGIQPEVYTKLPPDAVFNVIFHWIKDDSYCVHLVALKSRKKFAGRILGFLHEFLPEVIEFELKKTDAYKEGNK